MSKTCSTIHVKIKSEKIEAFKEVITQLLLGTKDYDGCLFINACQEIDDPNHFRLNTEWESEDARQSYLKWRTETGAFEKVAEFSDGPPKIVTYNVVWGEFSHN